MEPNGTLRKRYRNLLPRVKFSEIELNVAQRMFSFSLPQNGPSRARSPPAALDVETLKRFRHEVTSAVCEIIFWSADEVSRFFFSRLPSGQKWWKRFENDKIRNDYAEKY